MSEKGKKVFVAMSGGVDSSVAAALLKEEGLDVVGITMCFSINYENTKRPSCCGAQGIEDARRVAQLLDIPHYVLGFEDDIKNFIIENFTREYIAGRTPNPCVVCNQQIKFGSLFNKVTALGADYLATGHYCRIVQDQDSGQFELRKSPDANKDQSYFLYGIRKELLPSILFPVGELTKDDVREIAHRHKLSIADKRESQDICFVPESGYKEFIREQVGEDVFVPGEFKDHNGTVVGEHKGIVNYTIGQRDKLGIALGHPVYVYRIDKETNTVYVGPKDMLTAAGLFARDFNFISALSADMTERDINVKIRYNSPPIAASLQYSEDGRVRVDFRDPQMAVTPGQSVVCYRNDVVLGGGIIEKAINSH